MESKKFFGKLRYMKNGDILVLGDFKFFYNKQYYVYNLRTYKLEFQHKDYREVYKTFIDLLLILGLVKKEEV